jgi:hypothetical protein
MELVFRGSVNAIPDWRRTIRDGSHTYTLESATREGKRQDKMVRAVYRLSGSVAAISAS